MVEAADFFKYSLACLFRQRNRFRPFFQFCHIGNMRIPLPQLGLDHLHLLAQIEFALRPVHFAACTRRYFAFQLEYIQLLSQQLAHIIQTLLRIEHRQQFDPYFNIRRNGCRDHIGQPAGLIDIQGK